MSDKSRKWVLGIIFTAGFLLLCYPLINSQITSRSQKSEVNSYNEGVDNKSEEERQQMMQDAQEYNDMLFQSQGAIVAGLDTGILSDESYEKQLKTTDGGIMGSIEIPKIDVDLPIYHGTEDDVLAAGVGHQQGTSLPIGGESAHSCLTGHRGLPGSSLFTRLDEIVDGDLFFINVLGEVHAYQVYDIEVYTPEEAAEKATTIESGKDIVSLVTCTPYGINTHRLVVTGERVPYEKATYEGISSELPSWRELLFMALPFILIFIVVVLKIKDWRTSKRNEKKESE